MIYNAFLLSPPQHFAGIHTSPKCYVASQQARLQPSATYLQEYVL
ncbi:hypothetical protein imdm_1361 [gamma proteobacterium IMCC2047]|nr:hypothetical protein imdm_1361 [gamma proteobacterium IMCC2047]